MTLSWARSIHSVSLHTTSWISILILSSHLRLGLPNGLFPSGFSIKTLYTPLLSYIRATCSAYLILLDMITRIMFDVYYRSVGSSLCNFLQSPLPLSLLGRNILLSTLFSHNLSLRSSLRLGDQVSQPYKAAEINYSSVCLNLYVFRFQTERKKILHRKIASVPWLQSAYNFLSNRTLIGYCCPQIYELFHAFKGTITSLYIVNSSWILTLGHEYVLFAFTSSPISLLANTQAFVFFFIVCTLPPNILTTSAWTWSCRVPFNFKPSWFTWTLLMYII